MLPWGAWWATVWATVWREEWKHILMPWSEEKGKDASIRWDANKSESLMCSEIDGSRDKECGVTWQQLTTPSMFNFYLIPEKGRSSKEWAPSSSPFRKKLLPTPQVPKPGNRPIGDSPEWCWLINSSAHPTLSHRAVSDQVKRCKVDISSPFIWARFICCHLCALLIPPPLSLCCSRSQKYS